MNLRNPGRRIAVCAALLITLALGGCSTGYNDTAMSQLQVDAMPNNAGGLTISKDSVASEAYFEDWDGILYESNRNVMYDDASIKMTSNMPAAQEARKIILNAHINMETEDYAVASAQLREIVIGAGGFVENASSYVYLQSDSRDYKRGDFTFRVPFDAYESVKTQIEASGHVLGTSETSRDATTEFFDTESRVNALRAQETSLLGMIEKAVEVSDLILLEQRLSEIRTDIELYQSRMNTIDRQASFSTIIVNLNEVRVIEPIKIQPDTTWTQMKGSFIRSVNNLLALLQGFMIFLASAVIPLLLFGILVLVAVLLVRRTIRKNRRKRALETIPAETDSSEEKKEE